ncbi:Lrp/AsnC family transcriptional regulator [Nocardia sp. NPDC020380]|uniref:Lrp/AsnC family transcriptional regulator n=1 Tax=Nocardia sp. NPDC020380 TaxID=3364309 RepID=UPI00379247FB
MTDLAAGAPDTSTEGPLPPGSGISEQDLAIIDALQAAPRASWARIGQALDIDGTTAARRWERLRSAGAAWITAYGSARVATVAFLEVRCRPRRLETIREAVARLPWVFSVDETAGEFDLMLSSAATDLPTLGRWVRDGIGALRGVRAIRMRVGIDLYSEGGDWSMGAIPPAQRAHLATLRVPSRSAYGTREFHRLAPADRALMLALHADARMSYTDLGAAAGMSEHTARRRLERLLRDGDVLMRCDFAYPLAGLRTMVMYRLSVPQTRQSVTATALARLPEVRLCAAVSGRHGLLVHVLLPGPGGIDPFEELLAEQFPMVEIRDRAIVVRNVKRMGWLLDEQGRAIDRVPLMLSRRRTLITQHRTSGRPTVAAATLPGVTPMN